MTVGIPFTSLALVRHYAGGVILRDATGYIAGTYVPAGVVEAFATAGAALHSMGSSAVAIASSNPIVTGAVIVAVVAVGSYCYFHGVPAPVAETLVHAGLAAPTEQGLAITIPKLALALVLLGAAGYVAYRFYENFRELWADREATSSWTQADEDSARVDVERSFGADVWSTLGAAVWATKDDVAASLASVAQQALDGASRGAEAVSAGAYAAYSAASYGTEQVVRGGGTALETIRGWIASLGTRFRRAG